MGSLMYAMVYTQSNIAFDVGVVSQHLVNLGNAHKSIVKMIMWYLKRTSNQGLLYKGKSILTPLPKPNVVCYGNSNVDWAIDIDIRKSTSRYVFIISSTTISWTNNR